MQPKVSIIVPVYNGGEYLTECINSIISQSYSNLEIILVDDGSTDDSLKICNEFKARDKRIIVIHKENEGVSIARNVGIEISTGTYITFVDSDDYIEDTFIEDLYNTATENSVGIVTSDFCFTYENGKRKDYCFNMSECVDARSVTAKFLFSQISFGYCWGKLFDAALVKGLAFEKYRVGEDQLFVYNCLKNCKKVGFTSKSKYFYRQNAGSVMAKGNLKLYDMVKVAERIFADANEDLKEAAMCLLVINATYTYCRLKNTENIEACEDCARILKQYRKAVIVSKNAPLSLKGACMLSYISLGIMVRAFSFYQRIK